MKAEELSAPGLAANPAAVSGTHATADTGMVMALSAFLIWGVAPVFFKQLEGIPVWEIVAHRTLWSAVGLALLGLLLGRRSSAAPALGRELGLLRDPRTRGTLLMTTALIGLNWLVFLYAIASQQITAASLGYYINPLVLVVLGVLVLRERLRRLQWVAVGIAALGLVWLLVRTGELPWISLVLALSFGLFALLRKRAHLPPMTALLAEVLLLSPLALVAVLVVEISGDGVVTNQGFAGLLWMMAAGIVTTTPLALHAAAARRLDLSLMGIFQYIAPSINLALAVLLYHEPFTADQQVMFGCIWVALMVYTVEGWSRRRRRTRARRCQPDHP